MWEDGNRTGRGLLEGREIPQVVKHRQLALIQHNAVQPRPQRENADTVEHHGNPASLTPVIASAIATNPVGNSAIIDPNI